MNLINNNQQVTDSLPKISIWWYLWFIPTLLILLLSFMFVLASLIPVNPWISLLLFAIFFTSIRGMSEALGVIRHPQEFSLKVPWYTKLRFWFIFICMSEKSSILNIPWPGQLLRILCFVILMLALPIGLEKSPTVALINMPSLVQLIFIIIFSIGMSLYFPFMFLGMGSIELGAKGYINNRIEGFKQNKSQRKVIALLMPVWTFFVLVNLSKYNDNFVFFLRDNSWLWFFLLLFLTIAELWLFREFPSK